MCSIADAQTHHIHKISNGRIVRIILKAHHAQQHQQLGVSLGACIADWLPCCSHSSTLGQAFVAVEPAI
jgi:hypothetical protein